ncbi:hypothetical protein DICPUDRAFT_76765 [Dictyostelium purpureum]|uniref:NmrA-like domain-containing protein n=1 Tax=Dictyostelium purpureum TaxID=5786 RepID=F0ZEJ8_DICPU|nr:uncharacterized protein DICPUDRAFT_76765 [Dictyostelium purpureum]EGC37639.1 hypothetical protein DICPUDRAFT_76765 [Dictyostelium purpureum]|eukprot:XP_003285827.1 hypothetical protein DICPUDRAFT_76765 [Dictyostelium purpureum]
MSKLISVFGGTGQQGGAVVKALLNDGFKVRTFTRNTESETAKKLKDCGVEVIKCDESKPKEEIEKALKDSYGVFLVTNSSGYPDKETEYGCKVADAALLSGVQHFVFSTLPDPRELSNGKYNDFIDFNSKVDIEKYIRNLSKQNSHFISSFVSAPMYFQNFKTYFPLQKHTDSKDGSTYYSLDLPGKPDLKLDHGDINDLGPLVSEQFKNPTKYSGQVIPLSAQELTGPELTDTFTKVLGKKVVYNYVPSKEYAKSNVYVEAPYIAHLYDYFSENPYFGHFDNTISKKILKLTTFEEFLKKSNFQLD